MKSLIECYFLDVGQGSANVIDLGDGSAIVIDCGRNSDVLTVLLKEEIKVRTIEAVILTHNDIDHIGGVVGLIQEFKDCIQNIFLLLDRAPKSLLELKAIQFLIDSAEAGEIPEPENLTRSSRNLLLCERKFAEGHVKLELLFPSFLSNVTALTRQNANSSSAILLLSVEGKRVLYSGDADMHSWSVVYKRRNERPLKCDIIAVPHHAGALNEKENAGQTVATLDTNALYSKVIRATHAIVSVGTNNGYEHPNPNHISALMVGGACVKCTQITDKCVAPPSQRGLGLIHEYNTLPGAAMYGRGNGCAGTVLAKINSGEVEIVHHDEHQSAVDSIRGKKPGPRCRS